MSLPLTKEMVATAYDYLCSTPPFSRWNLPDSEDVVFKVVNDQHRQGWHRVDSNDRHYIYVSRANIGRTQSLIELLAHELLHVHQHQTGVPRNHAEAFQKWAKQVCKYHGFDPKLF